MHLDLDPTLITLRDFEVYDIPDVLRYWYRSPEGFIESIGVDKTKMSSESQMRDGLEKKVLENKSLPTSKLNALIIEYQKKAIGFHVLNPVIENESGIFHAHIWDPEMRGRGIGIYSYSKALKIFMERFNLERVIFKTPVQNKAAIRVKEKLGIRAIGEEVVGFGIIKDGTIARVFELTREELMSWPH